MDLLARRYASPFFIIDEMVRQGRFYEFVIEINKINFEEKNDRQLWEIWLFRVTDKSFVDWKNSLNLSNESLPEIDVKATVKNSFEILGSFSPGEGR